MLITVHEWYAYIAHWVSVYRLVWELQSLPPPPSRLFRSPLEALLPLCRGPMGKQRSCGMPLGIYLCASHRYRYIDKGPGLSPNMPCLFTAGLLSGALSHSRGNIEIYVFLEKYLHDFRYKNMLRISIVFAFDFT
jgi:hypothetical protein